METTAPRDAGGEARAWPDSTTFGTLAWAETPYMVVQELDDAWVVQKSYGALRGSQRPSRGCECRGTLRVYSLRFGVYFSESENVRRFGLSEVIGPGAGRLHLGPKYPYTPLHPLPPSRGPFVRLLGWFQPSSSAPDWETVVITRVASVTAPLCQLRRPIRELYGGLPEAALRLLLLTVQAHHSVPVPPQSKGQGLVWHSL
jgi:hypothetical protein